MGSSHGNGSGDGQNPCSLCGGECAEGRCGLSLNARLLAIGQWLGLHCYSQVLIRRTGETIRIEKTLIEQGAYDVTKAK